MGKNGEEGEDDQGRKQGEKRRAEIASSNYP